MLPLGIAAPTASTMVATSCAFPVLPMRTDDGATRRSDATWLTTTEIVRFSVGVDSIRLVVPPGPSEVMSPVGETEMREGFAGE